MLTRLSTRQIGFLIFALAFATIGGAWIFEAIGYAPCPLCLKQRWAYYAAVPLAFAAAALSHSQPKLSKVIFYLLTLVFVASAVFGIFHSGVEWKWWPGPATCGGEFSGGLPDLSKPAVRCDEAAIRILGLSLAGWNALISAGLAVLSALGARNYGSSSVSQ